MRGRRDGHSGYAAGNQPPTSEAATHAAHVGPSPTREEGGLVGETESPFGDLVELQVPASGAYLTVLRTTAARLAARIGFTLDDIEDLRIAVDEAGAMLLPLATSDSTMQCSFQLQTDTLDVVVSVPTTNGDLPGRNSFAWTVLSALAGDVQSRTEDGRVSIMLRKNRG